MMNMRINKQPLWYALYEGQEETFATDDEGDIIYDDIDGEQVPRTTGHWVSKYAVPVKFYGNINSGNVGEAQARSFGLSLADSEAVLCMKKGELPINEHTLIWYQNPPEIEYVSSTMLTELDSVIITVETGEDAETATRYAKFNPETADYRVKRVPPCLNEVIYLLGRLDNSNATS